MRLLFIHQNLPGQYRNIISSLANSNKYEIACIGESHNILRWEGIKGVRLHGYTPSVKREGAHRYVLGFENHILRGQAVAVTATELKKSGFIPDVTCVHSGWGEGLYLKDVFPETKVLMYCEFYYNLRDSDFTFGMKREPSLEESGFLRTRNATQALSFMSADHGISPTLWQKSCYPPPISDRISVVHEGIATEKIRPNPAAYLTLSSGITLRAGDKIVTFINRNLEPYRGFHIFMKAIPQIQKQHPDAHFLIVGADGRGYGKVAPAGTTYRSLYCNEMKDKIDWSKIHFMGTVPHANLITLYQISAAHVYLTYPFVLSWSALEAMSAECLMIGSKTAPVEEVITHEKNGLLVDFFSPEEVANTVSIALSKGEKIENIRKQARRTIQENFDFNSVCLPKQIQIISALADGSLKSPHLCAGAARTWTSSR